MPPSTDHPELLPEIPRLRRIAKSLAVLDAIICPEWEFRYYSYNSKWSAGEEMASMRDGHGNEWFLLFGAKGAALKGFEHELAFDSDPPFAQCIRESLPPGFDSFLNEPAFSMDCATFCLWRTHDDATWNVVAPRDRLITAKENGSDEMLALLGGKPEAYRAWAEDYYEREIPLHALAAIFAHEPVTEKLIAALNPELSLADIGADGAQIGYPAQVNP